MNWLAHLHLSEPTPEFRLGSVLPDMAPASALADLPLECRLGIQRHRQIDAFTDAHPVFRRSVQRVTPPFRRFGGVLIDVFYDHFLASNWETFSGTSLADFTQEVYSSFRSLRPLIPSGAFLRLQQMEDDDWLCSYREFQGIVSALGRISARLRRPFDLAPSIAILERNYDSLEKDFAVFFPELLAHVQSNSSDATRERGANL